MFRFVRIMSLIVCVLAARAATLEYLSLDEMTEKSTAIVRGRILGSNASLDGPLIYTHYAVQVLECWKGPETKQIDVVVLGGTAQGLRQTFSGTPALAEGGEYLLFLWTGPSGLTQLIGLSQGVFAVAKDEQGGLVATRAMSTDAMVDPKTGRVVTDQSFRLRLGDLRSRVRAVAGRGGATK
jgi:hypothetical protein